MSKNTAFHKSRNVMSTCALLVTALLSFILLCPSSGLSAENVPFTIIHSSNVNGHLFPCPT